MNKKAQETGVGTWQTIGLIVLVILALLVVLMIVGKSGRYMLGWELPW